MKKKDKYLKGFSMVEMLIVMGIFIILSVVGFNGFLSIRESFIARENVELIIQDIESTKLKAMNMEGGKDETWIYGFGIDFRLNLYSNGAYQLYKWCSPVEDFNDSVTWGGQSYNLAEGPIPSYFSSKDINESILEPPFAICDEINPSSYSNSTIPKDSFVKGGYCSLCEEGSTGIVKIREVKMELLDQEKGLMEILDNDDDSSNDPGFLFFESLTGRTIIYSSSNEVLNYTYTGSEIVFNSNSFIPLDIVLHRKRSDKFDLITVYPNSGEVIHHVYDNSEPSPAAGYCDSILRCIKVEGKMYQRYGIQEEINSFRD